jgi:hypothetical protein
MLRGLPDFVELRSSISFVRPVCFVPSIKCRALPIYRISVSHHAYRWFRKAQPIPVMVELALDGTRAAKRFRKHTLKKTASIGPVLPGPRCHAFTR